MKAAYSLVIDFTEENGKEVFVYFQRLVKPKEDMQP
jgi:hypothetical protein